MEAIDGADVREDAVDNISRKGTAIPSLFQQPGTKHLWRMAATLSSPETRAQLGKGQLAGKGRICGQLCVFLRSVLVLKQRRMGMERSAGHQD